MGVDTCESITEGMPRGIVRVLKNTRTAIPIVRLGISTGRISNPRKSPLFLRLLFIIPKARAVPRSVETVADTKAISTLFIIAFFAMESLNSCTNHFHVNPLRGKLYPSLLFQAKMNIIIMGSKI